jgi:hypothetical protein
MLMFLAPIRRELLSATGMVAFERSISQKLAGMRTTTETVSQESRFYATEFMFIDVIVKGGAKYLSPFLHEIHFVRGIVGLQRSTVF